jgi:D-alanine-D-alanine ligase-like ATP-grasp enzyme
LGAKPWRYFQLNADYFNKAKGLYSKQDINNLIPEKWRLSQWIDKPATEAKDSLNITAKSYPLFVKPEWGQNSQGILRADNAEELASIRAQRDTNQPMQYLIQEAAKGKIEFEIFAIPCDQSADRHSMLSVTQVINHSPDDYPINGIYNQQTEYMDITPTLSQEQLDQLWGYVKAIGRFRISRVGVRADSVEQLIAGDFKVIEINLFLPMPLVLLTSNTSTRNKYKTALRCTWLLAKNTKTLPNIKKEPVIFFKKLAFIRRINRTD